VSTEWIPVHPFASRIAIQQGERLMTRGLNVAGGVAGASGLDCCSLQIVDDHPLLRLGLRTLLSRDPNLRIVAECGDGACALNCMRKHRPDAVVLDITLPGGTDGLELIKQMLSEAPNTAILVLSVHDENLYASRVLSAGARGYLMKDAPPEHFLGAIRTVLAGEISVSPALAQRLVRRAVDGRMAPMDPSRLTLLLLAPRKISRQPPRRTARFAMVAFLLEKPLALIADRLLIGEHNFS
jgi:DNA-binding NarL/FixJ family response regulator